jgi:beta-galactosidase GanA
VARNEEYFSETQNAAEVGLFWSYQTANTYGGEIPQSDFTGETIEVKRDYMKSFQGAYEMLQRAHIPFKVVDSAEEIGDVKLLVLPNCACLTPDEITLLEKYVENGGKLMASFETSLYSRHSQQEDFGLSKLLGVRYRGIEEYGTFENYFQIGKEFFPACTYVMKVEPQSAAVIGYVSQNTKGSYQPIIISSFPAICKNEFGEGRAYYFCGNFFQSYSEYKFPKYLALFQRIFDSELKRQLILENTPESVEVTLRKKGNTLLIHLINFSSGLKRPIENIIPVENVVLKLPGIKAASVTCLLGQAPPRWQMKDEFVEITVPRLQEYEVIAAK